MFELRAGEVLDRNDQIAWEEGLGATLLSLHDDLDAAVFEAYGWPADLTDEQILEKLVALNIERAEEEKNGTVRWLRPDFQNPGGKQAAVQTTIAETDEADTTGQPEGSPVAARAWPKKMAEQITAVRDVLGGSAGLWTAPQVAATFAGAKPDDVPSSKASLRWGSCSLSARRKSPRWKALSVL